MKRVLLAVVLAIAVASCSGRQRVVTQPDVPLAPPAPPPRLVTPVEVEEPEPEAKPPEATRKPARPPSREPAREQKPPEPPKPVEVKPDVPPPKPPAPSTSTLQPGAQSEELAREAQRLLNQARTDRKNVVLKTLNADAKAQYDQASRFIDQAQQAFNEQNYVLAHRLAEKAATILGVLVGR